jgi:hypothetical protein
LALVVAVVAVIDGTLSSLLTCHPVSAQTGSSADQQQAKENCTALSGPVLATLRWIAAVTHKYEGLITAAFTIVLAVFTGRLWFSTEKLSVATKRLVEGAEDTAKRQLRAYFLVKDGTISNLSAGQMPVAVVTVSNSGQTPAYDVTHWAVLVYDTFPPSTPRDMDDPEQMPRHHVGPQAQLNVTAPLDGDKPGGRNLTTQEWDSLKSGKGALYFFGRARYVDCFRNPHFTEYCMFIGGPFGVPPAKTNEKGEEQPRKMATHFDGNTVDMEDD